MNSKLYIIGILVFALSFLSSVQPTQAVGVPYGGPILMSYECTCSGGWFVLTYDYLTKMPVPLVFQFGASMLHANYNIFVPTVQTTGAYVTGGVCLLASLDCGGFATQGTISPAPGVGTGGI